jgi:hypothetical protein
MPTGNCAGPLLAMRCNTARGRMFKRRLWKVRMQQITRSSLRYGVLTVCADGRCWCILQQVLMCISMVFCHQTGVRNWSATTVSLSFRGYVQTYLRVPLRPNRQTSSAMQAHADRHAQICMQKPVLGPQHGTVIHAVTAWRKKYTAIVPLVSRDRGHLTHQR